MRFYALSGRASDQNLSRYETAAPGAASATTDEERPHAAPALVHELAKSGVEIGGREGRILSVRCLDEQRTDCLNLVLGSRVTFQVLLEASSALVEPNVGIELYDRFNQLVFGTSLVNLGTHLKSLEAGQQVLIGISVQLNLMPGEYTISAAVADQFRSSDPNAGSIVSRIEHMGPLTVSSARTLLPFYGLVGLPAEYEQFDENASLLHQDSICHG